VPPVRGGSWAAHAGGAVSVSRTGVTGSRPDEAAASTVEVRDRRTFHWPQAEAKADRLGLSAGRARSTTTEGGRRVTPLVVTAMIAPEPAVFRVRATN
jgi:hypothetical protein